MDPAYLNRLIGKWMPNDSPQVAVDSHPRLSGIMDTINSTLGHGPATRLPNEFYDPKLRNIIEKIGCEEWFSGYQESQEYRTVGIGSLVGDVVTRMVGNIEESERDGLGQVGGELESIGAGRGGENRIKFSLSGCHDTTLAGLLSSFGAFKNELWPPYTSDVALELFSHSSNAAGAATDSKSTLMQNARTQGCSTSNFCSSVFGSSKHQSQAGLSGLSSISRKPLSAMTSEEKKRLGGYYVRLKYNDRPVTIPGCGLSGKHLEGDKSFCTLVRFKYAAET